MSYLALYRKYRPSSFDDLVGQNEVADIIKNEILNNKISHAYLFSGPRGTGKTSTAKIIAKMINCFNLNEEGLPCEKCDSCLNIASSSDVVEIDAASNNGVDEIRELRDKVNLVPTYGRYKIYIIDEVHMLTTQAFNALLKTLEEPPQHAIFILATTEFHKIPATVVSRCQKFQFHKFSNEEIVGRLKHISNIENIKVSEETLFEIARLSDGGLRDAINMLDQLSSFKDGELEVEDVYKLNGVLSYEDIYKILIYIYEGDATSIVSFINNIDIAGKNIDRFLIDFIDFVKNVLIYKSTSNCETGIEIKDKRIQDISQKFNYEFTYDLILSLNDLMTKIKNSNFSIILVTTFFLNLIRMNKEFKDNTKNSIDRCIVTKEEGENHTKSKIVEEKKVHSKLIDFNLKKIRINNCFATADKKYKDEFISRWNEIKKIVNNEFYSSIIGILDDIEVLVVGKNSVMFLVKYDSLLDRIYNYIDEFEKLLFDYFQIRYKVVFLASDEWNFEKNNYITSIKNGKKYIILPEHEEDNVSSNHSKNNSSSDLDKLISMLGEEVIEYK